LPVVIGCAAWTLDDMFRALCLTLAVAAASPTQDRRAEATKTFDAGAAIFNRAVELERNRDYAGARRLYEESRPYFERAARLNPADSQMRGAPALVDEALQDVDRWERAYRAYERGMAASTLASDALNADNAYAAESALVSADRAFAEALALTPEDPAARHNADLVRKILSELRRGGVAAAKAAVRNGPQPPPATPAAYGSCLTDWRQTKLFGLLRSALACKDENSTNWDKLVATLESWASNPEFRDSKLPEYRAYYDAAVEALPLARAERDRARKPRASEMPRVPSVALPARSTPPPLSLPNAPATSRPALPSTTRPAPPAESRPTPSSSTPSTPPTVSLPTPVRGAVPPPSIPDTLIGSIASLEGAVYVQRQGKPVPLTLGAEVHYGDTLVTGSKGRIRVRFPDQMYLDVGPRSTTTLDRFFAETNPSMPSLVIELIRGIIRCGTGGRFKEKPHRFKGSAGYAATGVRSTDFTLVHNEADATVTLSVHEGTAFIVEPTGNSKTVTAGGTVTVPAGLPPRFPLLSAAVQQAMRTLEPIVEAGRQFVPLRHAGVWASDRWQLQPTNDPELRQLQLAGADVWARLGVGRTIVPVEDLPGIALLMFQRVAPDAKIVSEDRRQVGGVTVSRIELDLTSSGTPYRVVGQFFAGPNGIVDFVVVLPRRSSDAVRGDVEALLAGLVVDVSRERR
jgi:tetratricopeptide (TPR) repeat protein